jgi:hypothetical protein
MRRLNDQERVALREVGPPGEGPVSPETFNELIRLGWGCWAPREGLGEPPPRPALLARPAGGEESAGTRRSGEAELSSSQLTVRWAVLGGSLAPPDQRI